MCAKASTFAIMDIKLIPNYKYNNWILFMVLPSIKHTKNKLVKAIAISLPLIMSLGLGGWR